MPCGSTANIAGNQDATIQTYALPAIENNDGGVQTRDNEPTAGGTDVDQLLGGEARLRPQVSEVALRGARSDAHELSRTRHRAASRDVGGEDVKLAGGC
jgi:hypothetical protein